MMLRTRGVPNQVSKSEFVRSVGIGTAETPRISSMYLATAQISKVSTASNWVVREASYSLSVISREVFDIPK